MRHEWHFLASFWSPEILGTDRYLCANDYQVRAEFITHTADNREINLAIQRCLYMLDQEFSDTVFLSQDHQEPASFMRSLGMDVTTMPGDPVDQMIGMMLYCKFNAVMEGRVSVTHLEISSERGDHVWYLHDQNESLGPFAASGWWTSTTPTHADWAESADAVPTIQPDPWHEAGLTWPVQSAESTVVYANFHDKD